MSGHITAETAAEDFWEVYMSPKLTKWEKLKQELEERILIHGQLGSFEKVLELMAELELKEALETKVGITT